MPSKPKPLSSLAADAAARLGVKPPSSLWDYFTAAFYYGYHAAKRRSRKK